MQFNRCWSVCLPIWMFSKASSLNVIKALVSFWNIMINDGMKQHPARVLSLYSHQNFLNTCDSLEQLPQKHICSEQQEKRWINKIEVKIHKAVWPCWTWIDSSNKKLENDVCSHSFDSFFPFIELDRDRSATCKKTWLSHLNMGDPAPPPPPPASQPAKWNRAVATVLLHRWTS